METKNLYDGLVIKTNDQSLTGSSDCALCCLNCNSCHECPLTGGFYFAEPNESPVPSPMSEKDKRIFGKLIKDLSWLTKILDWHYSHKQVYIETIGMANSYLDACIERLSTIKTFDK